MSQTGRKRSRGNQASTESHSIQSSDPSPDGDTAVTHLPMEILQMKLLEKAKKDLNG